MASSDTSSHTKEAISTPISATPHAVPDATKEPEVNKIFRLAMKLEASDVHLKVNCPPMMRIRGYYAYGNAPAYSARYGEVVAAFARA